MYEWERFCSLIRKRIGFSPVTVLTGPRQCGKTTLARMMRDEMKAHYFDLEDPRSVRALAEPMLALEGLNGLVIIDEIQRTPELFPILRVLADRRPLRCRFLILGSASPELLKQNSESLAGRSTFLEISGFLLDEVKEGSTRKLWWRGRFPRAFLARTEEESRQWQMDFVRTFLERDLAEFGNGASPVMMRKYWMMLAHLHGGHFNAAELAASLGVSATSVFRHLEFLTSAMVVRQLRPYHANSGKRVVKAAKVYVRDSGLLHALLEVPKMGTLEAHPKLGASWEGFVIDELLMAARGTEGYFYRTHAGAELDLLLTVGGKKIGVEVKYGDAPGLTKSMHVVREDLKLDHLYVVYPREEEYRLAEDVTVAPLESVRRRVEELMGGKKTRGVG